jgi:HEAT repeat protein
MENANELHNLIATALTCVVKQIKAVRYYPAKHPALQAAAKESLRSFEPILGDGNHLSLTIRKEGFLFDDSPVAKSNQVLAQLATFCFARRIKHLTFLADLKSSDLHHFVHYLRLDPQTLQKQGGIQTILEKARLTTIWTNIRDLDKILERREEIEEIPEDPEFDPAAVLTVGEEVDEGQAQANAMDLETLLTKMEQESNDTRFQESTQELIPLLRLQINDEQRPLVLRAFLLFCRCGTGKQYSEERRQNALLGLSQLATEATTDYLVAYLTDKETEQKTRTTLIQVLAFIGSKITRRLMDILADESSAPNRKLLTEILVRSGPVALPIINQYLSDERWFVVRNAITILGDIRSQESLAELTLLLQHDEIRIRRETIRALTKIGGKRAIKNLLQTAVSDDQELQRQAILSLGAMRATVATPTLMAILKQKGWSQRGIDLKKDTIRALGEIRDTEAIPELLKIVKKRRWLHRQLNDELRVAAAAALGDIAEESTRGALEKITNDKTATVARAAAQALMQLDKANT